jgi:hypothetical protein
MVNDYVNEVINEARCRPIRTRRPVMDEGQGRYTMGGYAGPSEQIPADTGGVNMRPPGALPFNPTPRGNVHQGVAASAPATRRQLPRYALLLASAMVLFGYAIGGLPIALLFAVGLAIFGGLVFWARNL